MSNTPNSMKSINCILQKIKKYCRNAVIRNSFFNVVQFLLPTILLLVFTPFFVHKMGTENYGLWMIANSALGLMGIVDIGLNTAISKFVAESVESSNPNNLSAIVTGGFIAYILVGIGLSIPLYIYSPALAAIFKSTESVSVAQIADVIRIISLGFLPMVIRSGAVAIPIGLQKFQIPTYITLGYQCLIYTAALIIASCGGSITQVVGCNVLILWMTGLVCLVVAWRMLKPFGLKFIIKGSHQVLKKMLSFAIISGISGVGSQIFNTVDRLVVGATLGLNVVGYYSVIISAASKILQLNGSIMGSLMPAISSWMASGEIARARKWFIQSSLVQFILNFVIVITLLPLSGLLLRLWMGEEFANHTLLSFRVLIVIYALISLSASAYHVAYGVNKPGINALTSILGGCFTIGLIFYLGKSLGLLGAALANGGYLITLITIFYVYFYLNKLTQQKLPITAQNESTL